MRNVSITRNKILRMLRREARRLRNTVHWSGGCDDQGVRSIVPKQGPQGKLKGTKMTG